MLPFLWSGFSLRLSIVLLGTDSAVALFVGLVSLRNVPVMRCTCREKRKQGQKGTQDGGTSGPAAPDSSRLQKITRPGGDCRGDNRGRRAAGDATPIFETGIASSAGNDPEQLITLRFAGRPRFGTARQWGFGGRSGHHWEEALTWFAHKRKQGEGGRMSASCGY